MHDITEGMTRREIKGESWNKNDNYNTSKECEKKEEGKNEKHEIADDVQ